MDKIDEPLYEFDEPITLLLFYGWVVYMVKNFSTNLVGSKSKPLHEWIELFLDWTEYTDYQKRKKNG